MQVQSPAAAGGLEPSVPEMLEVWEELAWQDASVGWIGVANLPSAAFAAAYLPEGFGEVFTANDNGVTMGGQFAPNGTFQRELAHHEGMWRAAWLGVKDVNARVWEALQDDSTLTAPMPVSLVYLAFEIRHNTKGLDQNTETMRLSVENEIRSELNGFRIPLATDDALSSIWSRGLKGEDLDANEQIRFDLLLLNIVAMITTQTHAHQRGYYDLERRIPHFSFIATTPGFRRFWQQRALKDTVREDVRSYIDTLLEQSPNTVSYSADHSPAG